MLKINSLNHKITTIFALNSIFADYGLFSRAVTDLIGYTILYIHHWIRDTIEQSQAYAFAYFEGYANQYLPDDSQQPARPGF